MMFLLTYPKRNESVFFYDFAAIWCEKSFRFEHICIRPIVWISKDPIQDWKYRCIFGNCVSLVIDVFQGFMRNCHGGNTTKSLYLHDTGICVRQPNMRSHFRLSWLYFWPVFLFKFLKNCTAIYLFPDWGFLNNCEENLVWSKMSTSTVCKNWRILVREAAGGSACYAKKSSWNIFNFKTQVLISPSYEMKFDKCIL